MPAKHAKGLSQLAWVALLAGMLAGAAAPCPAAVRRALLSIDGVLVPSNSAIFAYRIETFGVDFLALCRLPASWELKSERFENPGGYLSGAADTHGEPLQKLSNFYLVDVTDYSATPSQDGAHPASFSGWVKVGGRERFGEWHGHKSRLKPGSFHLKDAKACPPPPPPLP